MRNIYLLGFMGAGKSTIGSLLAERLDRKFVDTDLLIVGSEGISVNEIFELNGESYFRDVETACLEQVALLDSHIVATGGGVVDRQINRATIENSGHTVFLETDWDVIQERVAQNTDRPLAAPSKSRNSMLDLYNKRLPFYRSADLTIETNNKSVNQIVNEIIEKLSFSNGNG